MSSSLDYFELQFSEQVVLEGESLFDLKAVSDLLQVEKRLWIAIVEDEDTFEVELLKPESKGRQSTCDCTYFHKHKECKHIVAAMFALRAKKRVESEGKRRERKVSNKTFNLNLILDRVGKDDLVRFLKSYGKKDKKFATLMKAHFARSITGDFKNKYKSILQTVVKPVQTAEVNIGATQVKHFVNVCTELTDQLEDAMVLEDFKESIDIWESCVAMNEYVMHYTHLQATDLNKLSFRLSQVLKSLLVARMSPQLRIELIESSLEIASRSYYHFRNVSTNILELIYQSVGQKSKWSKVMIATVEDLLDHKEEEEFVILSALKLRLQFHYGKDIDTEALVKTHGQDISMVVKAIVTATDFECAATICQKILELYPEQASINVALVEVYQFQKNVDGIRKLAFDALVAKHEMRYFDLLKEHTPKKEWSEIKKQFLQLINKVRVRTELLTRDQDWKRLLEELRKAEDLNLTMQYTYRLNLNTPKELALLYEDQVRDYLNSHIGSQAGVFFREVLLHLETVGALSSIKKIHKLLDREFPHRTTSVAR